MKILLLCTALLVVSAQVYAADDANDNDPDAQARTFILLPPEEDDDDVELIARIVALPYEKNEYVRATLNRIKSFITVEKSLGRLQATSPVEYLGFTDNNSLVAASYLPSDDSSIAEYWYLQFLPYQEKALQVSEFHIDRNTRECISMPSLVFKPTQTASGTQLVAYNRYMTLKAVCGNYIHSKEMGDINISREISVYRIYPWPKVEQPISRDILSKPPTLCNCAIS